MIVCSAPGKLFLSGEYAVLDGSPAVVTAVDRRATARQTASPEMYSPIMAAVLTHALGHLAERHGIREHTDIRLAVASNGFRIGKQKLGLGSSAAVAASAVGFLFEHAGLSIARHRSEILDIAKRAHTASQQGRGSGADVAASVLGRTIRYTMDGPPEPVRLDSLHLRVVWSGRSVSTGEMIAGIHAFSVRDPADHERRMAALRERAVLAAAAFQRQDAGAIIQTVREYATAMDALGAAAGVPIVTKTHRRVINLASAVGGAAKPSGAGGGDIAVAFFDSRDAAEAFQVQCIRHELPILDLEIDTPGLQRDASVE